MAAGSVISLDFSIRYVLYVLYGTKKLLPIICKLSFERQWVIGARFKISCPHKHACRSSWDCSILLFIFYLPETSSQILSPMSGILVFLYLISPCFCQTTLISSAVIRSVFAWIMDNLKKIESFALEKVSLTKAWLLKQLGHHRAIKHLPLLQVGYWAGRLKWTKFKVYFRHKYAFWPFSHCCTLSRE